MWIRCSGHEVEGDDSELIRKYDVKNWDTSVVQTRSDLQFLLAQSNTTPTIMSRKKKLVKKFLGCCFSAFR